MKIVPVTAIAVGAVVLGSAAAFGIHSANDSDTPSATTQPTSLPTASTAAPKASSATTPAASTGGPTAEPTQSTPTTAPPAAATGQHATTLSIKNLLSTGDLAAAKFTVKPGRATAGEGDLQYPTSPCLKTSIADVTGGNVFAGDWYASGSRFVAETVTTALNSQQATSAAKKIAGWHTGTCAGQKVAQTSHGTFDGGESWNFTLTGGGLPAQEVMVARVGSSVGVVAVVPTSTTQVDLINRTAVSRLE